VDALIAGELLGGRVDRVSVESITRFFLGSFRERLALDRASAMTPEERMEIARVLRERVYGKNAPDVRESEWSKSG
jgi:hypothetical protein